MMAVISGHDIRFLLDINSKRIHPSEIIQHPCSDMCATQNIIICQVVYI